MQIKNPGYSSIVAIKNTLGLSDAEVEACFGFETEEKILKENNIYYRDLMGFLNQTGQNALTTDYFILLLDKLSKYIETQKTYQIISFIKQGQNKDKIQVTKTSDISDEFMSLHNRIFAFLNSKTIIVDSIYSISGDFDRVDYDLASLLDTTKYFVDCDLIDKSLYEELELYAKDKGYVSKP